MQAKIIVCMSLNVWYIQNGRLWKMAALYSHNLMQTLEGVMEDY